MLPDSSILIGQKLMKNAKNQMRFLNTVIFLMLCYIFMVYLIWFDTVLQVFAYKIHKIQFHVCN